MPRAVRIENIGAELRAQLYYYSMDLSREIVKAVDSEAKELKKDIQDTAPVRTKEYKRGFRIKKSFPGSFQYSAIVHNKERYNLVHLIEKGRGKEEKIGSRPHIFAAREKAAERLERRVSDIIGSW